MKNIKKIIALVLICTTMLSLFSCSAWDEFIAELTGTTDPEKPSDFIPDDNDITEDVMKLNDYALPFWVGDRMYDESVMLVAKTDAAGNVIEAPRAKLLFEAENIESVTWYFHVENGSEIKHFTEGADFIYAKNWSAFADESYGQVLSTDMDWTVDAEKMALTNNACFMHCLPVRRNMIVTDEVIEAPTSLVIPEAANREISAQVVLKRMLEDLQ